MDGFVFRLGSGAGRRPTTTSRTILNYYPWLTPWLIISAQLCWPTAAADFLYPAPAADLVIRHSGQEDLPAAPPTEAPHFNHLNVQIENNHGNRWSTITLVLSTCTAFLLGIMCFGMMDYGHQPANAAPRWHPDGNVPFRQWMQHVSAWLNVVSARMTPTAQAASLQLSLQGTAREVAMSLPPAAITHGAMINGVNACPVTYLLYILANRFEALEDERIMQQGTSVLDFRRRPGETRGFTTHSVRPGPL